MEHTTLIIASHHNQKIYGLVKPQVGPEARYSLLSKWVAISYLGRKIILDQLLCSALLCSLPSALHQV